MTTPDTFRCYLVEKTPEGIAGHMARLPLAALPPGEVLVRVAYSSLNYKDAMAAQGNPGVVRALPHVPGIDAAGTVAESDTAAWAVGDPVLATGFGLGSDRWGGFAEYIRVPAEWLVRLPEGLSLREAMTIGTAGLTAAMCVEKLQAHAVLPGQGEVIVSGATGGVGSHAVALLSKLGYRVAAVTGKPAAEDYLRRLGAARIVTRQEVDDRSDKALLPQRWAGAIDTVGGNILATILRGTAYGGCVTACGLTAGNQLAMTVYPFILRDITLTGIDMAMCPLDARQRLWQRLAGPWKPDHLDSMAEVVELEQLGKQIDDIRAGRLTGRVVVAIDRGEATESAIVSHV